MRIAPRAGLVAIGVDEIGWLDGNARPGPRPLAAQGTRCQSGQMSGERLSVMRVMPVPSMFIV
jgi:hypothetical protein